MPNILPIETERKVIADLRSALSLEAIATKYHLSKKTVMRVRDNPQQDQPPPPVVSLPKKPAASAGSVNARAAWLRDAAVLVGKDWNGQPDGDDGSLDVQLQGESLERYLALRVRKMREPSQGRSLPRIAMRLERVLSERSLGLTPSRDVDQFVRGEEAPENWETAKRKDASHKKKA